MLDECFCGAFPVFGGSLTEAWHAAGVCRGLEPASFSFLDNLLYLLYLSHCKEFMIWTISLNQAIEVITYYFLLYIFIWFNLSVLCFCQNGPNLSVWKLISKPIINVFLHKTCLSLCTGPRTHCTPLYHQQCLNKKMICPKIFNLFED